MSDMIYYSKTRNVTDWNVAILKARTFFISQKFPSHEKRKINLNFVSISFKADDDDYDEETTSNYFSKGGVVSWVSQQQCDQNKVAKCL